LPDGGFVTVGSGAGLPLPVPGGVFESVAGDAAGAIGLAAGSGAGVVLLAAGAVDEADESLSGDVDGGEAVAFGVIGVVLAVLPLVVVDGGVAPEVTASGCSDLLQAASVATSASAATNASRFRASRIEISSCVLVDRG
jgi:hypothetical protein